MWSRAWPRGPGRAGEGVLPRRRWCGGGGAAAVVGAAGLGGPPRPHRARGKGQLQMKKGRTSVSCPFMESICSWRPAIVANKDAWSVILLAAFCGFCALL